MSGTGKCPAGLWHYTCDDGYAAILADGWIRPISQIPGVDLDALRRQPNSRWTADVVWLTDLDQPDVEGLGLTREMLGCDRSAHRLTADPAFSAAEWWPAYCRRTRVPRWVREDLEPGRMPGHWWVSTVPVPVLTGRATVDGAA